MAPTKKPIGKGRKKITEEYFADIRRFATAMTRRRLGSSGVEDGPEQGRSGLDEVNQPEQGRRDFEEVNQQEQGPGPEEVNQHEQGGPGSDDLIDCIIPTRSSNTSNSGAMVPSGRHIRFKSLNSQYEEGSTSGPQKPKKCLRGLAKCKKFQDMIAIKPLKATWDFNRRKILINNDPEFDSTQIIRFINGHVRTRIVPIAPTFRQLPRTEQDKIWGALTSAIEYHVAPNQVYQWLLHNTQRRYCDFLGECKWDFLVDGRRPIPEDFIGREHVWDWLCDHFESKGFKTMSAKMTKIVKDKPKHTVGSRSFDKHSLKRKKAGALTPGMETYAGVYNKHGDSDTVQKVREEIELQKIRAAEAIAEGRTFEVPSHVEAKILQRVTGTTKKWGCIVPGMGAEYKRPPKP